MEGKIKEKEVKSASISWQNLKTVPNIYITENALVGQKLATPVSTAMREFIKNEFSKVKL